MNKLNNLLNESLAVFKSKHLLIILIILLASSLPTLVGTPINPNFHKLFYDFLTSYNFFFIGIILISVVMINTSLKDSIYILRYKNYKEFYNSTLKRILLFLGLIFIINLIFNTFFLLFKMGFKIDTYYHEVYNIDLALYNIFFLIREVIILYLITKLFFNLFNIMNKNIAFFISLIFIFLFFITPNRFSHISFLYSSYLTNTTWTNFNLELLGSIIQIIILSSLVWITNLLIIKKSFVSLKYQFLILLNNFKKHLWKWLLVELIFLLIYLYMMGLGIEKDMFNPNTIINLVSLKNIQGYEFLEFLIFLFNITLTSYITYNLYIYEYHNSLEFIALRVNNKERNIFKLLMILSFILIYRISYYLVIYVSYFKYIKFTFLMFLESTIPYLILSLIVFLIVHLLRKKYSY